MRKFAKIFLVAGAVLLGLYALALLGLNIYLQSETLQRRIRSSASQAVGMPVSIRGTHYTPWSGFCVSGISVPSRDAPGRPPAFEIESVSFRFGLWGLLHGRLSIQEVLVTKPTIVLFSKPAPTPSPTPPAVADVAPTDQVTGGSVITPPPLPAAKPVPTPGPQLVELHAIRVTQGTFRSYDAKGALILGLDGVDVKANVGADKKAEGKFLIAETSLGVSLHPKKATGSFSWEKGTLIIPDLRAEWAGGKLSGTLDVNPARDFVATAAAEGLLLKILATDAGIGAEGTRGSLYAKGRLKGRAGQPETYVGGVDVTVHEARIQPADFIRQIGELTGIQELQTLELKTAEGKFSIRDKKVVTESAVLESANLILDATGPTGFDGKMKLQARLHLNDRLRGNLAGLLGSNFKPSDREGYQQVPFNITGTVSRPKTDLLEKLTGFRIGQDVGGLLKNLFRAAPDLKKGEAPKNPGGG